MLKVLGYATCFFLVFCTGYGYGLKVRDDDLEAKRIVLENARDELLAFDKELQERESQLKDKWKSMVDDFSQYNAYVMKQRGEYKNKWSDWDDTYLQSWMSADK